MIKFFLVLMLAACLQLSARSYGQNITLQRKNASLKVLMVDIFHQTGYYYYGKSELLDKAKPVDIDVRDASLKQVLDLCFKDQPLLYSIEDKTILVYEKPLPAAAAASVLVDIRGKVLDEKGDPLVGATVMVKGTMYTVKTNPLGEFILQGIDDKSVLVISNVGYETLEMSPGKEHNVMIRLRLSVSKLDEVQVIAYGTVTKRLNTGNVSTVKGEDIAKQPVLNPLEALEGRVAGLSVAQTTGLPGGFVNVQLRGQNSLRNQVSDNGNYPLYIIDGIPYPADALNSKYQISGIGAISPLNSLNPDDIESIDILKDADATAIYGSRGANGVIIISTKKGKAGKTAVDVKFYSGAGKVTRLMHLLNTPQYLAMRHEAYANDGETPGVADAPDLLLWDTTRYTDWQKQILGGTAHSTDAQASISGGNNNTQFLIGGAYHRQTTVYPGDYLYQKASCHFNISHTSEDKKLMLNFSGSYVSDNNNLPFVQMVLDALITPPNAPPIYDSLGRFNYEQSYYNLFSDLGNRYISKTNNLVGNFTIKYDLGYGFNFRANLGYNSMSLAEMQLLPASTQNPAYAPFAYAFFNNNSVRSWIAEPQLSWNNISKLGKLDILVGASVQRSTKDGQAIQGSGYSSDQLIESLAGASNISLLNNFRTDYRYEGIFARINYNSHDRYLIDLTGRRDGSSRFGAGRQFANFGAAGAAWIFSKESFFEKNIPVLSFGKLRASYGITGSDQIPDYGFLSTYTAVSYFPYQGSSVLQPSRLNNPDFSWETNRKLELSLELGFLKNRILLNTSVFRNRSSNQLVGYALPEITGFRSIQGNLPAIVQNTGIEIELNTINIRHADFSWTSSINLTLPSNKLVSYPNIQGSSYSTIYAVGQPLTIKYKFHSTGVDPATGVYQYQDIKQGGSTLNPVYPDDLRPLKKVAVTIFGGFQNSLKYRNWELDFLWQFVKQTGGNYASGFADYAPGMMINEPLAVLQRWQKPGDVTSVQQFTQDYGSQAYSSYYNYAVYGDNSIVDASFIRLKNLAISYQFSTHWMNSLKTKRARIFIQAQNLITITHYNGFDPENMSNVNLPPLRMITAGFQVTL